MQKIIVRGGNPISGNVRVSGSKNAALPIIFASLLVPDVTVIDNVPEIGDVSVALEIITRLGAKINRSGNRLFIDATHLEYSPPREDLISKIRASTYLIGASLARFGVADIGEFGGCNFSSRPIDFHLRAAEALGARREGKRLFAKRLYGAKIHLPKPSVGATINAAIMAACAMGETEIFGFAREPHVFALFDFLSSIGVFVEVGENSVKIRSGALHKTEFTIIGDMIEAGTYLIMPLVCGGSITVSGIVPGELSSLTDTLLSVGYKPMIYEDAIFIDSRIKSQAEIERLSITASPYPGFPTDLQPITTTLLSKFGGTVTDSVWQERFGYLKPLSKMGLRYSLESGIAKIEKGSFHPASVTAPDLRGGMALLIAALSANGESEILSSDLILRGYDHLIEKLSCLGAEIKIVNL